MPALPERTRAYLSYGFDSRNWDRLTPRDGDIVISTSYKSGTTWMQNIVLRLLFRDPPRPAVSAVSPWLDKRSPDLDAVIARLEAQEHRRFIKSHLPLDAVPYSAALRYIVVVRDPRDVFMSFWNHYSEMTEPLIAWMNDPERLLGAPMPRCPDDIHALWRLWISRGWFPWESEGYPHSGNMYHTRSWWNFRHLENVLFVHFNDLLAALPEEIGRVADFLGIAVSPAEVAAIAEEVRFDALRKNAASAAPMPEAAANFVWRNGLETFFNKGTNGRWRDVLTADELAMYARAKRRWLPADCALYLETGRAAWPAAVPTAA